MFSNPFGDNPIQAREQNRLVIKLKQNSLTLRKQSLNTVVDCLINHPFAYYS